MRMEIGEEHLKIETSFPFFTCWEILSAKMATVAILQQAPYGPSVSLPAPYPEDSALPFSLRPQPETSLDEITAEIEALSKSGRIEELLNQHGAIYFQDLKLKDAQEFSKFTHAFGFVPHEDIGNPVRRTILAPNVATANEGPNTMPVYPHNEFGLSPHYPAYVFFYCVSPPETGGWLSSPPEPWAYWAHANMAVLRFRGRDANQQLCHPP